MNGKKRAATASAVCIATLAGCVALFSCAPVSASSENSEGSSYAELIEQFPLEYQSSQQERIADNGYSMSHSVSSFRDICEAPVVRDNNGADVVTEDGFNLIFGYEYNEETGEYTMPQLSDEQLKDLGLYQGCLSCKTSKFNDLFEKLGPEAFGSLYNADARDVVADEYWDCASCHNGTPSADTLSANIVYWQNLKDDSTSKWGDVRNEVCLQCHNSSDYRSKIKTDEDLENARPWRNGNDFESVFETCYEDGTNFSVDEATGIRTSYALHTQDFYMGTKMQEMGVTCADCHMPNKVDEESGEEYTSHFAANSPIEDEDSLEYCLSCHESLDSISTTADMKTFVEGVQAECADGMSALDARIDQVKPNLETAITSGALTGDVKEAAIKAFAKATFVSTSLANGANSTAGSMAAMYDWEGMLESANSALDEVEAAI